VSLRSIGGVKAYLEREDEEERLNSISKLTGPLAGMVREIGILAGVASEIDRVGRSSEVGLLRKEYSDARRGGSPSCGDPCSRSVSAKAASKPPCVFGEATYDRASLVPSTLITDIQ
jgi:hypothetical protein